MYRMASEAVREFHRNNAIQEKRAVALRINYGTKASTPQIIGWRRQHPQYKGLPDTSTGSRTSVFFQTPPQDNFQPTHIEPNPVLSKKMKGGVIKNFPLAQELLKKRAESSLYRDILYGNPAEMITKESMVDTGAKITPEFQSKILELDNLIRGLLDLVDIGDISQEATAISSRIIVLFVQLAPTFDGRQLADFQETFTEMYDDLEPDKAPRTQVERDVRAEEKLRYFAKTIVGFIEEISSPEIQNIPAKQRPAVINSLAKKYFGITIKGADMISANAFKPNIPRFPQSRPANPMEVAPPQIDEVLQESSANMPMPIGNIPTAPIASRRRPPIDPEAFLDNVEASLKIRTKDRIKSIITTFLGKVEGLSKMTKAELVQFSMESFRETLAYAEVEGSLAKWQNDISKTIQRF